MSALLRYKFGTVLGPAGKSAGIALIFMAILIAFRDLWVLVLLPLGLALAFMQNACTIDLDEKKYRWSLCICGIIEFGKWQSISNEMFLKLKSSPQSFRYYSRSNRSIDVATRKYRVLLINKHSNQQIPVQDFISFKEGRSFINDLGQKLNIKISNQ